MKVLVTGGAGYIGSTTAKALEQSGHVPVILDSLVAGHRAFVRDRAFYGGDISDRALLTRIFEEHPDISCTLHMAARIVVPESVQHPYEYYRNNVFGSLELFDQLVALGRPRVVFSSSASVYESSRAVEVSEDHPLGPVSPYARTKLMIELALTDITAATDLRALTLRYFNPIGADPDLESGVYARQPTHVIGQLMLAATSPDRTFTITGTGHPTRDGTGIRDYIHVWDLARAHVAAVERFDGVVEAEGRPHVICNIGTGTGITVRELVAAFEDCVGHRVRVCEAPARHGDAVGSYANVEKARALLHWHSELSVRDGLDSTLRWWAQRRRVLGYA